MNAGKNFRKALLAVLVAFFLGSALFSTGCAVHTSGMTLPNPYYLRNRVQYFPAGPEAPFPKENAQLAASQADFQ